MPLGAEGDRGQGFGIPFDQLRRFWDLPVVMLGVVDYDGWFVHVSAGYTALLGWPADELKSAPYWEFLHPADQHHSVESGQALMDDKFAPSLGHHVRMLCRDGRYRWTRWNTAVVPEEQLFYGVGLDASDLMGPIEDHTAIGTWQWDIPSNTVACSPELTELLGLPASAAASETFCRAVHPDDRTSVDRSLRWSLASGEAIDLTFRILHRNGTVEHLHVAGRVTMTANGNPARAAGIGCRAA